MPRTSYLLKTTAGKATAFSLAVGAGYIGWLFTFSENPDVERWVSAFCLDLSYALFVYFAIRMLREYRLEERLRRSWTLWIVATFSIFVAEAIFVLQGRPALSLADPFFVCYYILLILGILSLPFVPISRREKSLLLLDLAIVMLASLLMLWYFLVDLIVVWAATKNYAALVNILIYPVLDLSILACAVVIIQRDVKGLHPVSLLCLAIANGIAAIGDVFLIAGSLGNFPDELNISSAFFIMTRFLVLLAVPYQVSFLRFPEVAHETSRTKQVLRVALPYMAIAMILVLLAVVIPSQMTLKVNLRGVLFGTLGLIAIVLYRQYLLYQDAKEAREEAEKATQAKAEFLANMSHEIRTPMHGLIGMSELLINSELNEKHRKIAETIRSSGNSLLAIISEILDFSKIESGRLELISKPFDFRTCIDEAFDPFRIEAEKKGIKLTSSIADSVPGIISGDETRIREIALNLLSNAVKFTDQGEIELKASAKVIREKIYEFEISVRDTGIGIPENLQNKLFQPFSQIDASSTRRYGGTGLGLAISKRLCGMMDGNLWVESRPGKGSSFYFTFQAEAESAEALPPQQRFQLERNLSDRLPLRILVADDNPVHQIVAVLMLEQMGYRADVAKNGIEAVNLYLERRHDLVFMDMQMPEMDGLESSRRIRQAEPPGHKPFIIALTASAIKGDREKCLAAGMNEILTKPVLIQDLQSMILRLWNLSPVSPAPDIDSPLTTTVSSQIPLLAQIPEESRREVLDQMVTAYLSDSPGRVRTIRKAVRERDFETLREQAHALKGASTLMGIHILATACGQLEHVNADDDPARTESLVIAIEKDYELASAELTSLLGKPLSPSLP